MFKQLRVVTHNGRFHADDCFAAAALFLLYESKPVEIQLVRTRDELAIKTADIVFDVGGVYDEKVERYDHHQPGGAGARANGVPYAAFGLFWKRYGEEIAGSPTVAAAIDSKLVQPVDAYDNGVSLYKAIDQSVQPYIIDNVIGSFVPTWKESAGEQAMDGAFSAAVSVAQTILRREIKKAADKLEAEKFIREAYARSADKRLLVLDSNYPWREIADLLPEVLFVIHPEEDKWHALAVRKNLFEFENRKDFPKAWAGKRTEELAAASGVPDAIFCHNKLFIAVARSKEGAIELAKRALAA